MQETDRQLECASCGQSFAFTEGERAWFEQRGLQTPRRCKECRAQQRQARASQGPNDNGPGRKPHGAPQHGRPVRAPQGNGNGNGNGYGEQQNNRAEDPNGYRAPAFREDRYSPYAIDYAGLPRDEEEDSARSAPGEMASRMGMRTETQGRGRRGPRRDNAGTDPNAYRAPTQHNGPRPAKPAAVGATGPAPEARERRNRRSFHETNCAECGAAALVSFQPSAERPAFCKTCYQTRKSEGRVPMAATRNKPVAETAAPSTTV